MIEIKRVALYARFSSDHQRTESIDAQIRAMKEFCDHNRWKIVETYIDEAYSATNDRRPSFQRMITDSGKGLFDIVLVHKLDRFSRNRYDSAVYKNKLKHNGVRLCSVLERLDDSPESIILEAMLESIGEYYSSNIAREVEYIQLQSSKEKTIEIYEQINTLESQRIAFGSSRNNLQELEAVEYADFCGLIDSFFALQEEPFRFRTFIRDYIKSITVYRESVVFSLDCGFGLLDGVVREISAKRIDFKTPSQRM